MRHLLNGVNTLALLEPFPLAQLQHDLKRTMNWLEEIDRTPISPSMPTIDKDVMIKLFNRSTHNYGEWLGKLHERVAKLDYYRTLSVE